jgi:hypothetical protein
MRIYTDKEIAGIRFDNGHVVPLAEAFAYANREHYGFRWPRYVIWADGFESFAKGWRDTSRPGYPLCRIGAGSYGDMLIATD